MTKFVSRFAKDESGATAIEYGLIVALIAVVIIGAVTTLGSNLSTTFKNVADPWLCSQFVPRIMPSADFGRSNRRRTVRCGRRYI